MSKTKVIFPAAADIYWHDGGKAMSDVVDRLIDGPASTRDLDAWRRLAVEAVDEIKSLRAQLASARKALEFYADEWRLNGDGDSEAPGLSRSWMEPTDKLHDDEGRLARETVAALKDIPNV